MIWLAIYVGVLWLLFLFFLAVGIRNWRRSEEFPTPVPATPRVDGGGE